MNKTNDPLDDALKRVTVPERSEGYWEHFPKRVGRHLGDQLQETTSRRWRRPLLFLATSAACVLVALGVTHWKRSASQASNDSELARSEKLYREIAKLFPEQVKAVVVEGETVRLVLSEESDVPRSSPLFVRICARDTCRSVITFSGQRVQVNGETIDVLSDARGNVIVMGRHFAWSSAMPTRTAGGYRIGAQPLGARS